MTIVRNSYLDNIKFILIFLVVFGHCLGLVGIWPSAMTLYTAIYTFHMPAFAFVAGHTSRPRPSLPRIVELLTGLVVFQVLYLTPLTLFASSTHLAGWLTPYWILWYLLSLVTWQLSLPLLLRIGYPMLMSLSLALAAGFFPFIGDVLSLSRSFVFLPFFMAGHLYGRSAFQKLESLGTHWRFVALLPLAGVVCACALLQPDLRFLQGNVPYSALDVEARWAWLHRLEQLLGSGVTLLMFFAAVPTGPRFWTSHGARTLPVFLLHGFLLIAMRDIWRWIGKHPAGLGLPPVALISAGLAFVLSSAAADKAVRSLTTLVSRRIPTPVPKRGEP